MKQERGREGISRRALFIGGGLGIGLLLSWQLWPRKYPPNMGQAKGEHIFGPWLKIAEDGKVIVGLPQQESGQGVYTALAQIIAGELGADWRTVAVQPVMPSPNFANHLLARDWAPAFVSSKFDPASGGEWVESAVDWAATRNNFVATGGSTSIRQFEQPCREAAAAARALLCMAAAERWDTQWENCDTEKGFVVFGKKRLSFAELAAGAALMTPPRVLPVRPNAANALSGQDLPRLDSPAKVDGSANFAGDVRLPNMLFASVRAGPIGATKLKSFNKKAGRKIAGVVSVISENGWVAALASNWWAANRALDIMAPVFEARGTVANSGKIAAALDRTISQGKGRSLKVEGSVEATLSKDAGTRVFRADYSAAAALHAPLETRSATAHYREGRLQLWMASQTPDSACAAAAEAVGIEPRNVILHPMLAGGSFDRNFDNQIAAQVAVLSQRSGRPVQLIWSRPEDIMRDHVRPPALARMTGTLNHLGQVAGLSVKVSSPSALRQWAGRLDGGSASEAIANTADEFDPLALAGAVPPYNIANITVDHFPVGLPVPVGPYRAQAHGINAFFIESFIDELAYKAGIEPLSFRMQMLSGQPRLARCLTGVSAMAGWDGGLAGSSKGIACHSMAGSHIAIVAIAKTTEQGVRVESISATVDCGRLINPDIARQVVEGGIVFGLAQALGGSTEFDAGLPLARRLRELDLPLLGDTPEIVVEFIRSEEEPGGLSELGVPAVAPAIANALFSASGARLRDLPLLSRGM